jgi:hypothetical protein
MPHNQSCIILKPTSFFASFIAEQLPDFEELKQLNDASDSTVYAIPICDSDEALFEHLERLYPYMFRYEVSRLFGEALADRLSADFLDFLCCFKFDVHSEPLGLGTFSKDCCQLVCVKPRTITFEWAPSADPIIVKDLIKTQALFASINRTTVLVKHFDKLDIKPLLQRYCRPLLQANAVKKTAQVIQWSTMQSWRLFDRYFAVEVHTQLVHLH